MNTQKILQVENLSVAFRMYRGGVNQEDLRVITNLNVDVHAGEIVAVVGSSGSGKSVLADAVLGLSPDNAVITGSIQYLGQTLDRKKLSRLRGREITYIPQSVLNLDPMMRIGKQVNGLFGSDEKRKEIFRKYELDERVARAYPHQLSGGMIRRVLIAGAIINDAKLIIADEPTPGLSEDLAERVMLDFEDLARSGYGILMITHDINLAIRHADRIAVFYAGTTVETAPASDFTAGGESLRHPYSKALWRALPQNRFEILPGTQPYAGTVKSGCVFADRCIYRTDECGGEIPARKIRNGEVRCIHAT